MLMTLTCCRKAPPRITVVGRSLISAVSYQLLFISWTHWILVSIAQAVIWKPLCSPPFIDELIKNIISWDETDSNRTGELKKYVNFSKKTWKIFPPEKCKLFIAAQYGQKHFWRVLNKFVSYSVNLVYGFEVLTIDFLSIKLCRD